MRLADVHGRIFKVPALNDRLHREQTLAKIEAMSESRTFPPDAGAAKIALIARPYHGIACGGAARFSRNRTSKSVKSAEVQSTVKTPQERRFSPLQRTRRHNGPKSGCLHKIDRTSPSSRDQASFHTPSAHCGHRSVTFFVDQTWTFARSTSAHFAG